MISRFAFLTASEIYRGDCEQKGANCFIKKPLQ